MANSKVVFEVVATSKGLKVVAKDINATSKATDKLQKSQDRASKSQDRFDKGNKAVFQSNLSSAKSFSKMNQTIGGDGGSGALVGSYAILAANVFAVSAAFNTLRGSMQVEKLAEGLVKFGNQSGQSLLLVSERLQEATGHAVSLEQAMTTAALSTSAGFGVAEMEGLTRVAKGASQALGRDMGDALDRLTRGAIKLEPEILDELGIMVRLDDATEAYAASLGKTASSLTRFEKQQAFMNAIITEGEMKFGAIADSVDPNPYDQLAASFADLSHTMLKLLNGPLTFLINVFLEAKSIFVGLVAIFAGNIAKKMIPAFGNMSRAALQSSMAAKEAIEQSIKQGTAQASAARKQISATKDMPNAFRKVSASIKDGTATTQEMTTAQQQLSREINKLGGTGTTAFTKLTKAQQKLVRSMEHQREQIIKIKAESGGTGAQKAFDRAQAGLKMSEAEVDIMGEAERQTFTLRGTKDKYLKILNMTWKSTGTYSTALTKANGITKKSNFFAKLYRMTLSGVSRAFRFGAISAKVFGKALLGAIPIIGQIIMVLGILFSGLKFVLKQFGFFSEASAASKEAMKDLKGVIDDIPSKVKEMADQQERAVHSTTIMSNRYKIIGGLIKTINDETKRTIDLQQKSGDQVGNEVGKGRNFGTSAINRRSKKDARMTGARGIEAIGGEAAGALEKALGDRTIDQFLLARTKAVGLGNALNELQAASVLVETNLSKVGMTALSLGTTFQEAEKEAGKFMVAVQPATKFDGIITNFDAMVNGLESLRVEAAKTGADLNVLAGEAGQKIGISTAMLLGGEVFASYVKLGKVNAEILNLEREKVGATEERKAEIDETIATLTKGYKEEQKNFGEQLVNQTKVKRGVIAEAKAQVLIFKEKEKFDKAVMKRAKEISKSTSTAVAVRKVETSLDNLKVANLRRENSLIQDAFDTTKDKKDLTDKEQEVINQYNARLEEIATIEAKQVSTEQERLELKLEGLDILKKEVELQNKLFSVQEKIATAQLDAQVRAQRGGNAEANKAETSGLEMKVAEAAYALAVETNRMNLDRIDAEHELLKAQTDVEVLKNKAEIASETSEDGTVSERGQALTSLNEALEKGVSISGRAAAMQRKIGEESMTLAALTLNEKISKVFSNMGSTLTDSGGGEGLFNAFTAIFGNAMIRGLETKKAELEALLATETAKGKDADAGVVDSLTGQIETTEKDIVSAKATDDAVGKVEKVQNALSGMGTLISTMFGEEGQVASAFAFMGSTFLGNIDAMTEGFSAFTSKADEEADSTTSKYEKMAKGLDGLGAVMSSIGALGAASGKQKVAAIDSEIEAEKKRDGKSKESLAKIKALEQKKEAQEKKNFERNKKMQMAMTVINTASAVMKAAAEGNVFKAIAMAVFGAAQLAIIGKTQFNSSGGATDAASAPQEISVGKRDNKVDTSRGVTGGELAFLRGSRGVGSNANSFIPGGAAGMKSYAGGTAEPIMVGERGAEVITPTSPFEVIPNDKLGGGTTNANFTINAIDAAGVEEVLTQQRGNIIQMIRDAAHEHGEEFIEGVNTSSYEATNGSGGGY